MSSRTGITSFPSNLCLGLFPVFPTDLAGTLAIIAATSSQLRIYCWVCMQILILMEVVEICLLDLSQFVWNSLVGAADVCEELAKRGQVMGKQHALINCFCGREILFHFFHFKRQYFILPRIIFLPCWRHNDKARVNSLQFFTRQACFFYA